MTPAIKKLEQAKIIFKLHEYNHDPACTSYGEETAAALQVSSDRLFKTLVVMLNDNPHQLAVGVVPVAKQLDLKAIAHTLKAKKAAMADTKVAERTTGYLVGGISPLGQKKSLPTVIDTSAQAFQTIYVSAGRRGAQVELTPQDLIRLINAAVADIAK